MFTLRYRPHRRKDGHAALAKKRSHSASASSASSDGAAGATSCSAPICEASHHISVPSLASSSVASASDHTRGHNADSAAPADLPASLLAGTTRISCAPTIAVSSDLVNCTTPGTRSASDAAAAPSFSLASISWAPKRKTPESPSGLPPSSGRWCSHSWLLRSRSPQKSTRRSGLPGSRNCITLAVGRLSTHALTVPCSPSSACSTSRSACGETGRRAGYDPRAVR